MLKVFASGQALKLHDLITIAERAGGLGLALILSHVPRFLAGFSGQPERYARARETINASARVSLGITPRLPQGFHEVTMRVTARVQRYGYGKAAGLNHP